MSGIERFGNTKKGRPYIPVIRAGEMIYTSGYTGFYEDGTVPEDFAEQFRLIIEKARRNLRQAGAELSQVVNVTIYLTDHADYGRLNELFADVFGDFPTTRSCVEVSRLSTPEKRIEMDFVGFIGK